MSPLRRDNFPFDDDPETFFIGKRVLTQAGIDAAHKRAVVALASMNRRRIRYERWQRVKAWVRRFFAKEGTKT